ncbi:hypothetical protein F5887DRAFT_967593 [Amanita rubescens]|nr:hypothetical protein F5887DRAFT_967593 [Amanita rubescens]
MTRTGPSTSGFLPHDQKKICIIGAGSAGLVALKVLKDSRQYKDGLWLPSVFEARQDVGGVWLPSPPGDDPPLTPLYDSLTTNLPHPVMAFTDYCFPPSTPVFPPASVVQTYLRSYAEHFDLIPYIRFNTSVTSVEHKLNLDKWKVNIDTGEEFLYDMVVVCNGHYRLPRYPDVPGLDAWRRHNKATHSAWYRRPELSGNILVVGSGPSGNDISADLLSADSSRTVIHSMPGAQNKDEGNLKIRGRLSRFEDVNLGQVVFEDGMVDSGIDHCILATGYQSSFPFLSEPFIRKGISPLVPPLPLDLYDTSCGVFPLAKHILPFANPTIGFVGLPLKIIPFPLAEYQACAIFHIFAHREAFDIRREATDILTRYERLRREIGDNPFDYCNQLREFAAESYEIVKVEKWVELAYANKAVLRQVWRMLEKSGEAEKWVKGVGEKGKEEWVALLDSLLKKAKAIGLPVVHVS